MNKERTPTRSSAHRKEDFSKRAFEQLIEPYFVQGWIARDYGIDSVVELTSEPDRSGDVQIISRCFLAQLKSTEVLQSKNNHVSFSVPVTKIIAWHAYNLPVLFVIYDFTTELFYFQWIDDSLVTRLEQKSPNWLNQKTVSVKIPVHQTLSKSKLADLRLFVDNWKAPVRKRLLHGKYFSLQRKTIEQLEEYKQIITEFDFSLINEDVKKIETEIHASIYKVAITGPSRVGKSTIVNKLLKKEVSPTGFFQTTGVPIQVIPGNNDSMTVYFKDNVSSTKNFSLKEMSQYASQEFNVDNCKAVQLISITIKNDALECGVSLFDIPGLDDPNDDIQNYTRQTLKFANAIIYVIDSSPFEDGGYIFRNEYKKEIESFSQTKDKVFLVFNKVDKLSPDVLEKLRVRVSADLIKYNLHNIVGDKIFYLSAKVDEPSESKDSLEDLRNNLWDYILSENKSGITKLVLQNQELFNSINSSCEIISSRLLDIEERRKLEIILQEIRNKLPRFVGDFRDKELSVRAHLRKSLDNYHYEYLHRLEKKLRAIPAETNLPSSKEMKEVIVESLNRAIQNGNKELLTEINKLKNYIDNWMEENLKVLRQLLYPQGEGKKIDFEEIENLEVPGMDISSSIRMGFIGAFAAYLIAPTFMLFGGIVGFLGNLFSSSEDIRSKQISQVMDSARNKYSISFTKIHKAYDELVDEHINHLKSYIEHKTQYYFNDIQVQIDKFNTPITDSDRNKYVQSLAEIESLRTRLSKFDLELKTLI